MIAREVKAILSAAVLLWAAVVRAEVTAPATVEFMFDPAAPQGVKMTVTGKARYLKSVQRNGGAITNGWWQVVSTTAFGQGSLQFHLDRAQLTGDLALVLRTDWQKDTNIAVQLFDAEGRAIALDLFGEMPHNARAVGTDTFVVPLNRYPDATSVMVRRLSGELRVVGGGIYPVLSEVTAAAETEKALAEKLGVLLSPHHWMFAQTGKEAPAGSEMGVGEVHAVLSLERTNQVGADALHQGGYPAYRPLTNVQLVPPKLSASNTTEAIVNNALRMIALRSGGQPPEPHLDGSDIIASHLLTAKADMGFMSIALSSAEKEKFFRDHGYSIVEFQFARDAIQILVNASNPINSVTVPQLDAIFGKELRAGAPALIENWSELGGSGGQIKAVGGYAHYGTSRVFQQLVLKGGEFRSDLTKSDVVYSHGVEKIVAENSDAIGFATLRPRTPKVRAIAVASNSGQPASLPNADAIYSGKYPLQRMFYSYVAAPSLKEGGSFGQEFANVLLSDIGQTMVARAGSLPLMANEVIAERAKLGLPK
jgi:phosphate transport system substrate-binding protein